MGVGAAADLIAPQGGMATRLKAATADSHRRLEADIDILETVRNPDRLRRLVSRFWGFHRVWEPAAAALIDDEAFFGPRRKLHLLQADLHTLGLTEADIARLEVCHLAAPPMSRAGAYGSLYVLEGSTLGGQIIHRALRAEGHAEGLRYFNPYGAQTGERWRAFRARIEREAGPGVGEAMPAAAVKTFNTLHNWLLETAL